ncbi:hypothetical protein QUF80_19220 [Desulfococcaceae bacterium HSG8]|nr:hypothetical protein [Desulfococcaceae bacterium HSG8]
MHKLRFARLRYSKLKVWHSVARRARFSEIENAGPFPCSVRIDKSESRGEGFVNPNRAAGGYFIYWEIP